jgi:hypothetical protein
MSTSISSPFFLGNAQDLVQRLDGMGAPEAQRLAAEARDLVVMFQSWVVTRPSDDVRVSAIQRLFELNRRAMDFLAKHGAPASGGRGPKSGPVPADGGPTSSRRPSYAALPAAVEDED